jgi:hypothetical protein
MALATNLAGSCGVSPESTFGTYVAPGRWLLVDQAAAQLKPTRVQGQGLAAGRAVAAASQYVETDRHAEGSIQAQMSYSKWGVPLNMIFGGTPTVVQQGASAAWLQTHSHNASILGKSMTVQVGNTEYSTQTVKPFTMLGGKVTSANFSCAAGELLNVNLDLWGKDLTEAQTLVAPSYTSQIPFHFGNLTVKIGASYGAESTVQGVTKVDFTLPRPLNNPLYAGATTAVDADTNDFVVPTGTISSDLFLKATLNDRFAANTTFSMVWEWVGPTAIASTFFPTFRLKFPSCQLTGDSPMLDGPDVNKGDWTFEVKNDLTNAPVICEYMSTDTAI